MQRRLPFSFWLPMGTLLSVALWYGCEQKGDLSPVSSARDNLAFIDTIIIDPPVISPLGTAWVEARVVNEQSEPAAGEEVRFTATRGSFGENGPDVTIAADNYGIAKTLYTAPEDTGNVSLHIELVSMQTAQSRTLPVLVGAGSQDGLLSVSADEDTLFADNGASATQIRARVRNALNNPIGGVEVTFSTSRGVITSPAVTDAQSGTAIATLTSTESVGRAMVIATYNDNSDTIFVEFLQPYAASAIDVNTSLSAMTAGSDTSVISARVIGEDGQTLRTNVVVTFSANAGSFSAQAVTTNEGVATTTYRAPVTSGPVTIVASTGTVTGNADITVNPGALASLTLTTDADTLWADNASETAVRALARDSYGNPALTGTIVAFSSVNGSVTESASTDVDGYATVTFRAGLNSGNSTVTALNGSIAGSTAIYLQMTQAEALDMTVTPRLLVADGHSTATIRAHVLDAGNRPVSNGTIVTFTSELGQLDGAGAMNAGGKNSNTWKHSSSNERIRNANSVVNSLKSFRGPERRGNPTMAVFNAVTLDGYAVANLTSATSAGSDLISAAVNGLLDEETVTYEAGSPASVEISPDLESIPADGASSTPVVCRVYDAYGNPLGGGVAISVTSTIGTLLPSSGFTNSSGTFTTNLTSARQVGNCAIVANAGEASGYAEVAFTAPEVAGLILSSSTPSVLADGLSSTTIVATVRDQLGLPVSGRLVTWSLGEGIGSMQVVTDVTDVNGTASALFFSGASHNDASQILNATSEGEEGSFSITMRGVTVLVDVDEDNLPANGEASTEVHATIRETSSGVAVALVPVRFATSNGSIQQFVETNESGIATAVYQASNDPGEVLISASFGDTLRAQSNLMLTNTDAENIVLTIGDTELLANGEASTNVSALVTDEGNFPVANVEVAFTSIANGAFEPVHALTDENGIASSTFIAAASESDVVAPIDVAIERSAAQDTLVLRGVSLNASCDAVLLPANGVATATVTVNLRESSSMIAISGATIMCGASLGSIPASAVTSSAGVATFTYTAGNEVGEATIIVRYGNQLRDTLAIQMFSPSPSGLELESSASSLLADGQSSASLTCRLLDQAGSPIANTPIAWSISGPGSLSDGLSYTDADGNANNTYNSSGRNTDANVTIRVNSQSAADSVTLSLRGITVSAMAQYSAMPANGVSSNTITAHVRETTSLVAVSGRTVTFGTSLGSIPNAITTDASGIAEATLVASQSSGNALVVCSMGPQLGDSATVNMYVPTPQGISVAPQTNSVRADGVTSLPVNATVTDAMGVPLANATVTWTASGISFTPVTTTTDAQGLTTLNFTPAGRTTNLTSTLTAASGTAQGTSAVTLRGVTVTASAVPDMVIADGSSTSQISVHVFETVSQIAIPEVTVFFGTNRGSIPQSAMTNSSGIASVNLLAATATGTATVTATYGQTLTAQTNVLFAASTPTTLSLTASPTILFADNNSASALTANVTDQNGNPVPDGTQVRFSIPPQSGSMENLRTTVGGVANNSLTSSSTPDTFYVSAWAEDNPNVRDSVQIIYRVGDPALIIMSATTDSLLANGIATDNITARVTDAVGHALPNVEVHFTATIGNITASRVTDNDGNATVPFSSSQTGTAVITAQAGLASASYNIFLLPGNPNSIQLGFTPNSVGVRGSGRNETLLITATVNDANNNPVVDGTPVTFNINNSPGGGDFLSSTGAIPTINGQATVAYNSGTVSGTARIRAVCAGISAVSTEILIYAGPPYIENISDGCLSSHIAIGASPCNMFGMDVVGESVQLVCLVGDRYNNPVTPGTAVYFTTSGGVVTTSTGYTDSAGFARVTLYSGNPLPTVNRWLNTITDPNLGTTILCSDVPDQDGVAKLLVKTAGVDATGDSVWVWATTNVTFDYSQPILNLREVTVDGDPNERDLYIGENALIRFSLYDFNYWPMVAGTLVSFSASAGSVYPTEIEIGCPGDTSYTISFFNNLTTNDDDAATPVLINVDATYGAAYTFTQTFTLHASFSSAAPPPVREDETIQ